MRKVLVADDSSTIRKVVEHALTGASVRVIQASEGREALLAAEREQPELILCDTELPGLNGYEIAARIREHDVLHGTPVLLMRGAFEAFDERRARECGATASIEKPFSLETLVELVQRTLEQSPVPPRPPAAPSSSRVEAGESDEREQPVRITLEPESDDDAPLELDVLGSTPIDIEDDEPLGPLADPVAGIESVDAPLPGEQGFRLPGGPARRPEQDAGSRAELAEEVRRQVAALAPGIIREIAWDVVPDLLERLLREARARHRTPPESGEPDR